MRKMVLLISIIVSVTILLFIAKPLFFSYALHHKPFNSSLWTSNGSEIGRYTHRQLMVDDLVKNILPGKKWNHIELMLGKGVESQMFSDLKPDLFFMLGKERSIISINHEWLLIYYDAEGYFSKATILKR